MKKPSCISKPKTTATIVSAAILTALMSIQAMAATPYAPVAGTSCNFNKYLIMDAGDTVPNVTFSFTVTPGEPVSATGATAATKWYWNNQEYASQAEAEQARTDGDGTGEVTDNSTPGTVAVFAGVGTPTIADVTFAPTDTTATDAGNNIDVGRTNAARGGVAGDAAVQLDEGEKYATKLATVDFSNISFQEPGIYRYIITEGAGDQPGMIYDPDADRVLDVYVTDDGTDTITESRLDTLEISGYVLHTDLSTVASGANLGSAGAEIADKTDGFTNEYGGTKDLKIEKEVTGNQASRDKYFEFTVAMAENTVNADDKFVVSLADDGDPNTNDGSADATSGTNAATIAANQGKTNPAETTGASLIAGQKFYLQHGQSIVIRGLPGTANYTVTENAEDYRSAVKSGDTNTGVIGTVAGDNKMATAGFTNTRTGVIPTGVIMTVAPFAGIALAGAIGAGLVIRKRKKEDEEEDQE